MVGLAAKKYAKAMFDLAVEKDMTDAFYGGAVYCAGLFAGGGEFAAVIGNPQIPRGEKIALAEKAFESHAPSEFAALFALLCRKNRVSECADIFERLIALIREYRRITTARVYSAQPLTEERLSAIRAKLAAKLNKTVELEAVVDAALIAGVKITVDGREIDGTVKKDLDELKKRMIMAGA